MTYVLNIRFEQRSTGNNSCKHIFKLNGYSMTGKQRWRRLTLTFDMTLTLKMSELLALRRIKLFKQIISYCTFKNVSINVSFSFKWA